MKRLIISGVAVLLLSLSARGQTRVGGSAGSGLSGGGASGAGGSYSSGSAFRRSALTLFHVTVVTGEEYVPSSFVAYDQALASGRAQRANNVYMSFDQAVAKGLAVEAVEHYVPAVAQPPNHGASREKSRLVFIQDNNGRIMRAASSSGGGETQ